MHTCICMEEKPESQYSETADILGFCLFFFFFSSCLSEFSKLFQYNPWQLVSGKEDGLCWDPKCLAWD